MSVITGDAVSSIIAMGDEEVVAEAMKVLRELFKDQVRTTVNRNETPQSLLHYLSSQLVLFLCVWTGSPRACKALCYALEQRHVVSDVIQLCEDRGQR